MKNTNLILNLIESVNAAFGIQVFCIIFVLLLYGIIMVYAFKSTAGITLFPTGQLTNILCYVHFFLLEISYYGSTTHNEVNYFNELLKCSFFNFLKT